MLPETQHRSEVRVRGDHDSPFEKGRVEDDFICSVLQPFGTKMDGVVPGRLKDARDLGR